VVKTPVQRALKLGEWEMGVGMSAVRRASSSPFYRVEGGAGRPDGEGNRVAGGGSINASRPIRWGGEMEG
jgi:hypothetical protein